MEQLIQEMNSSSLNKEFWVEEDFNNLSEHLKFMFAKGHRRLSQNECEKLIMLCNISSTGLSASSLTKAYDFLNNQTGNIILFNYVKKWLPNPSLEQWQQICKINSYYMDTFYFILYR